MAHSKRRIGHLTLQWCWHAAVPNPALRASESADATASRPLQFAPSGYTLGRGSGRAASLARHVGRAQHTGKTLAGLKAAYVAVYPDSVRMPWYRDTPLFEAHALRALGCISPIPFVAPIFFALARELKSSSPRATQPGRNSEAKKIATSVRTGEAVRFALYLRAFAADHRIGRSQADWRHAHSSLERILPFETTLTDMWWDHLPVVGLSTTTDIYGPGWITVQECDWKSTIAEFLGQASNILLVPFDTSGIVSECAMIDATGCLERVVFVMPPATWRGRRGNRAEWARVATLVAERFDWQFPTYDPRGRLFTLAYDGALRLNVRFSWRHTLNGMRSSIARFLNAPAPPAKDGALKIRKRRRPHRY